MDAVVDAVGAAESLREQAAFCRGRSPLYERLFAGLAGAVERGSDGGVVVRLLSTPGPTSPIEARLLIAAALHEAALRDATLPHAAWLPTAVTDPVPADEGAPAAHALAYLAANEEEVAAFIRGHRLQTNEVGRCAGLLPGFLVAAAYGMPLRLLEVGASAGLNLRADRYRYHYLGGPTWGPAGGPRLEAVAEGSVPGALVPPTLDVADRRGVDLHPIDPTDPAGARLLTSFVWPDEHDRHRRLRDAIAVARATPVRLDAGELVTWCDANVRATEGTTTVVFHSIVEYLLDDASLRRFDAAVERALRGARPGAPVVHLRLEPPRSDPAAAPELTVTAGDGRRPPTPTTVLTADWHGRWVRWW